MVTNPLALLKQENARLQDENNALREELRDLREFVAILNGLLPAASNLHSDEELLPLLEDIFSKALSLLNAPHGSLMLLDDKRDELVFMVVRGQLSEDLIGYRMPANQGIAGWVAQSGEPTLVRDVRRDERFYDSVDEEFRFRTQSIAGAPIIGDQKIYGVIEALNQPGDTPFSEDDLGLLSLLCRFAGEALADIERQPPAA